VRGTPPLGKQLAGAKAAAQADGVLPVGRKDVVAVAKRADTAHLCAFLALARQPQAEFPLPLEVVGLLVQAAGEDHVPVEGATELCSDV
jgi:hypothetical protein